jgi:23S rRNA pseudouridine2605 synthase
LSQRGTKTKRERIAKILARAGVASRRACEDLIAAGRVRVNGAILTNPATLVDANDAIAVDNVPLAPAAQSRIWRYHKPAGLVTTAHDPQGRPTVFDALPEALPRVISVGRLDINSEGLLLLTTTVNWPATSNIRRKGSREPIACAHTARSIIR